MMILYKNSRGGNEMKKNLQGLAILMLASVVTTGCSLTGAANTQKTVTINENVQLESSLACCTREIG